MTDLPAASLENMQQALASCQSELAALRRREAEWHAIFLSAPVALSLASAADGRLREVNARYAELMGLSATELTGRPFSDLHLLPADGSQERIASELADHAGIDRVASRYQRRDGALQAALTALRLVELDGETLVLSSTVEAGDGSVDTPDLLDAPTQQVGKLKAELAARCQQEQRLIGEISGLCTEAGLLKSDIIKLKQMQLMLTSEMERLRRHALLASSAAQAAQAAAKGEPATAPRAVAPALVSQTADLLASTPETSRTAGPEEQAASLAASPVVTPAAHVQPGDPADALWEVASARLQHVEEQLLRHVTVLREHAARMQPGTSTA